MNKKLREILLTLSSSSTENLRTLLPILLRFVTSSDYQIPKLVQSECINDLRAVTFQENVNMILNKLLKSWFGKIADDSQK